MEYEASFKEELWQDLRPFLLGLLSDAIKTLSILAVLYLFWEAVALLRVSGYPDEFLQRLEKTHFSFMWVALFITSSNFILRVMLIWRKK
jgi:hypothetical protein